MRWCQCLIFLIAELLLFHAFAATAAPFLLPNWVGAPSWAPLLALPIPAVHGSMVLHATNSAGIHYRVAEVVPVLWADLMLALTFVPLNAKWLAVSQNFRRHNIFIS